ncbi:MAG: hypothetical protein VKM34_02760 [Cyanobacteriota bacterium]|nr:hypothetical protein [Cyanobacteriota bacterium]
MAQRIQGRLGLGQSEAMALRAQRPGWSSFLRWFGDALIHAMGQPPELQPAAPPLLGVQPYHDRPVRSRRR